MQNHRIQWTQITAESSESDKDEGGTIVALGPVVSSQNTGPISNALAFNQFGDFNYWIGEVDFSLTDELLLTVEPTPGVEVLRPVSRYKFRMAIGKLFDSGQVRQDVERVFLQNLGEKTSPAPLRPNDVEINPSTENELREIMDSLYDHWTVYVDLDGKTMVAGSKVDDTTYQGMRKLLMDKQDLKGGNILTGGKE